MASIKEVLTKDGGRYYDIRVSNGRNGSMIRRRFIPESTWSKKTVEKKLGQFVAELELDVKNGVILSRTDAKKKRLEEEALKAEQESKILTVRQYVEKVYMPGIVYRVAENTRSSYQCLYKNHIFPVIGDCKMLDITSAELSAALVTLQKKGLSYASMCFIYQLMGKIFRKAYRDRLIPSNPMEFVDRPQPTKAEGKGRKIESYTAEELKHIIKCLENEPLKWRAFVRLLIDTGCRRGEASGLQWKNIDFESFTITIERSLNYTKQKGIYAELPKTGKTRTVPIGSEVIGLLKKLRDEKKVIDINNGWVFTQDNSTEPMHPNSPGRYFVDFGKKYSIANFHPHKLRHSYASIAITNGADIASVSENLGHSNKSTTLNMYTHASEEARRKASETFRNALRVATDDE